MMTRLLLCLAALLGLSGTGLLSVAAILALLPDTSLTPSAKAVAHDVAKAAVKRAVRKKLSDDRSPRGALSRLRVQSSETDLSQPQQPPLPVSSAVKLTLPEARMIDAINADRARHGAEAVEPDQRLMECARRRVRVMTNDNAHNPGGVWPQTAANQCGFFGPVQENFAKPWSPPEQAVWAWAQSPGHAACQRDQKWNRIGVGIYGDANVAMFGRLH